MFLNVLVDRLHQKPLALIKNADSGPTVDTLIQKLRGGGKGICILNKLTFVVSSPG